MPQRHPTAGRPRAEQALVETCPSLLRCGHGAGGGLQVKEPLLELRYSSTVQAARYDEWSTAAVAAGAEVQSRTGHGSMPREVVSNVYQSLPAVFRPVIMTAAGRSVTGAATLPAPTLATPATM